MTNKAQLNLSASPALRTRAYVRFANLLQMSEEEVSRLSSALESDPIFLKFYRTKDPNWKVFSHKRFPLTRLSPSFYQYSEEILPKQESTSDLENILLQHKNLVQEIKKLGLANFERFFLHEDGTFSAQEIAHELNIAPELVEKIRELTNQALLHSDFLGQKLTSTDVSPELRLHYRKIAEYSLDPAGHLEIRFFSPNMARGIYQINYDKLKKIKSSGILGPDERKHLQETIRFLEMLNARKNLIFKILHFLPEWQTEFFGHKDWSLLKVLPQKKAAEILNVTPAAVCRAIGDRSVVLHNGQEVPLTDLFPSKKDIQKKLLSETFHKYADQPDKTIQRIARKEFNITLSRRSINVYRREIMGKRPRS